MIRSSASVYAGMHRLEGVSGRGSSIGFECVGCRVRMWVVLGFWCFDSCLRVRVKDEAKDKSLFDLTAI